MIYNNYKPEKGVVVFSTEGRQYCKSQASGLFYFSSGVQNDIIINKKWQIAHIWQNGEFYYINDSTCSCGIGCMAIGQELNDFTVGGLCIENKGNVGVVKSNFKGERIAFLAVDGAISLASIQPIVPIPREPLQYGVDGGCWIVDSVSKKIIKANRNLEIVSEITNLKMPSLIVSTPDGGCCFVDNGFEHMYKVSSDAIIEGLISYSGIGINNSEDILALDSDINNNIWIVEGNNIKKIEYSDGNFSLGLTKNIIDHYSWLNGYTYDLSVEKSFSRDNVYVTGCSEGKGTWLVKLDLDGNIVNSNTSLSANCPSIVNTSQWGSSGAIYLISEDATHLPVQCKDCSCGIGCMAINQEPDILTVGGICIGI